GACYHRGRLYDHPDRRRLVRHSRPARPFARNAERENVTQLDAIELEILQNALTAAAAEMDVTVWRTSRSTIVRELLDYSTPIFDRNGWNVAQAARSQSNLNSMISFLTEILANYIPEEQWAPDDIVISNDPYC